MVGRQTGQIIKRKLYVLIKSLNFTLYSDGFQTFVTITHDQTYILHYKTVPKHMHVHTGKCSE